MSMTSLPIVSLLRDRMQWHQSRQKLLAENVANANTPGFKPKDLVPMAPAQASAAAAVPLTQTSALHLAASGGTDPASTRSPKGFETTPTGNAVSLEDEMMKVAENQSEYQLAASLYQKSLAMLRTAAGVRGS
jgi:flagellar basal-body rod protein FlgB